MKLAAYQRLPVFSRQRTPDRRPSLRWSIRQVPDAATGDRPAMAADDVDRRSSATSPVIRAFDPQLL